MSSTVDQHLESALQHLEHALAAWSREEPDHEHIIDAVNRATAKIRSIKHAAASGSPETRMRLLQEAQIEVIWTQLVAAVTER